MISVGFVGYRNHAARLRTIVESNILATVGAMFHPSAPTKDTALTSEFSNLLSHDAIVIASPNDTHYEYLERLSNIGYSGYIFCEKPVVSKLSDLNKIRGLKLDTDKIYFNFNYRFSRVKELIDTSIADHNLGKPIHLYVVSSQGLAFTSRYINSWRSDRARHPLGVTETKSVHYIDLAVTLFGVPNKVNYGAHTFSENGTAIDTSKIDLEFKGGESATILTSYAAPLRHRIELLGTNGYLVYDGESINIFSPRDTFSQNGRFEKPPMAYSYNYDPLSADLHHESLCNSMNYFLEICANRSFFPKSMTDTAFVSTELLLQLAEHGSIS